MKPVNVFDYADYQQDLLNYSKAELLFSFYLRNLRHRFFDVNLIELAKLVIRLEKLIVNDRNSFDENFLKPRLARISKEHVKLTENILKNFQTTLSNEAGLLTILEDVLSSSIWKELEKHSKAFKRHYGTKHKDGYETTFINVLSEIRKPIEMMITKLKEDELTHDSN